MDGGEEASLDAEFAALLYDSAEEEEEEEGEQELEEGPPAAAAAAAEPAPSSSSSSSSKGEVSGSTEQTDKGEEEQSGSTHESEDAPSSQERALTPSAAPGSEAAAAADAQAPGQALVPLQQPSLPPPAVPPALDFWSPEFDAGAALAARPGALQLPDPTAPALDYVAKCRPLLPLEMHESLAGKARAAKEKTGAEATRQKHEGFKEKALTNIQRIKERTNLSLQRVMDVVDASGPLSRLRAWQQARCRVCVVTRHASGQRGSAEGTLAAFDRFMNLVLLDVREQYTVLLKVPRLKPKPAKPFALQTSSEDAQPGEQLRWVSKQEHRQRSLGQVLLKGDNIIAISCAALEPQASGPAAAAERKAAHVAQAQAREEGGAAAGAAGAAAAAPAGGPGEG